jgi:hypothetical protein
LFRQTNTLRGIVLQRVGMMAYSRWHCFPAAGRGRNSFVAWAIKLRGLAGRHEKNANDGMLALMYEVMMNSVHFQCHCTDVSPCSSNAIPLL